jgi:hypothetical protein
MNLQRDSKEILNNLVSYRGRLKPVPAVGVCLIVIRGPIRLKDVSKRKNS